MTPQYRSPSRRETSREATIRAAMAIPGRFKPDGCWTALFVSADAAKPTRYEQLNRKYRRSGGRAQ